jgi:energy-coupling factor transport system permease protein
MAAWRAPSSGSGLLFTPGTSALHRANPLTTLCFALWMISAAAILPLTGTVLLTAAAIAFAHAIGVGAVIRKRLAITLSPLAIALILVHGFLVKGPDTVTLLGPVSFSATGFVYAATLFFRLAAMLTASLLFVTTTHPGDMLKSLDARGLSPVISYLVASPLLFLEPLSLRARGIQDAQRARGMDLNGSWNARIRALPALLIPLITLALSDLDHRVVVLHTRAFRAERRRTVLDAPPDDVRQVWLRWILIGLAVAQVAAALLWHH